MCQKQTVRPARPQQTNTKQKEKTETKKKCPRRLDVGMPRFEHFPVRDILKQGVEEEDDCQETGYGSFDDWSLDEDPTDEYDDYVQPTRKPLIFKQLMNNKPLAKKKYESKRLISSVIK